jgi:membrane-bound lytic murein transglycosylase D
MRFFSAHCKRKRLKISSLTAPLCVASTLIISACSTTPNTAPGTPNTQSNNAQSQNSHQPNVTDKIGKAGNGLDSIFSYPDATAIEPPYSADASTVWPGVRSGFQLDWSMTNPAIETELKWFRNNPAYLYRSTERSNRYLHYVVSALQQRNMPTELALLPIVESAYDPFAYSRSGAAGMWQFLPGTGTVFGLKRTWWYDGRKDVVASTDAALTYLQHLHDMFGGDWLLAVAAYNYGEGSIQRAIDENRRRGQPTDFWSLKLRDETRTYVPRLLALAQIVNAPHNYGINLYAVPNQAYFAAVDTGGQLDLEKAAALADIDAREVYLLNPGLNHWATDPQGPQRLLLPVATVDRFKQQLATLSPAERGSLKRYDVAKGDTIASISRKFGVDAASIRSANQLNDGLLHPGQSLLIPRGGPRTVVAAEQNGQVKVQNKPGATQILHTVAAGENLLRIAQRYGVTPQEVQRWNGIGSDNAIKLGQRLSIWSTAPIDKSVVKVEKTVTKTTTERKVGYTVQNGDSLTAIANRFNVQIDDILRWNTVNSRALLQPGQRLTLYPGAKQ